MNICPLSKYSELRRPHESKTRASWCRDARSGKIPGAFQFIEGGDWFVDLDIHDETVRRLTSEQPHTLPKSLPDEIQRMALRLNLSEEDIRLAMKAAGVKTPR